MKKKLKKFLLIFLLIIIPIQLMLFLEDKTQYPLFFSKTNKPASLINTRSTSNYSCISEGTNQMSKPTIAIDSGDITHVVWSEYNSTYTSYNIIYANSSTNFKNTQIISNISINDFEPSIAIDNSDIVHIAWKGSEHIYYTNSSSNFQNYTIISNQNNVSSPHLACDATGTVHVIWIARNSSKYNWDVFYANSSNLFSNIVNISQNSATVDEEADICIGGGIIYIVWSRKLSNSKYILMESNSTSNFTEKNAISQEYFLIYGPKADVDNAGNLHIIWYGKKNDVIALHEIVYIWFVYFYLPYYNDESLLPDRLKPFTTPFFLYYIYREGNFHVYYSNSTDFGVHLDISHSITQEAYTPDILIDSNNVTHIIWTGFVKSKKYYPISRVYYTNSSQNYQTFENFAMIGYEKYPSIALDSGNRIHCVFQSTIFYSFFFGNDVYHICYINSTNLDAWPPPEESSMLYCINFGLLYALVSSDMTILAIILLSALGGLNSIVLIIFYQRRKEKRQDKKVRDVLRGEKI
ncbi:MAG: hypothetical protein ACTSO9_17335 [Candidatus Helarchaeota archaeon]